jgi:hypothetical protein
VIEVDGKESFPVETVGRRTGGLNFDGGARSFGRDIRFIVRIVLLLVLTIFGGTRLLEILKSL